MKFWLWIQSWTVSMLGMHIVSALHVHVNLGLQSFNMSALSWLHVYLNIYRYL